MSEEATYSSSLGVEEVIATISVLILAGLFLGYYLWPSDSTPALQSAAIETPAAATAVLSASDEIKTEAEPSYAQAQSISVSGDGETGSRVSVAINGAKSGQSLVDSNGNWEVSTQTAPAEDMHIEIKGGSTATSTATDATAQSQAIGITQEETVTTTHSNDGETASEPVESSIADLNGQMIGEEAAVASSTPAQEAPLQTAMLGPQATTPSTEAKSVEITEPVITFLDRDRTTNELIISGSTPESEGYVVLLINGTTTQPVKSNKQNKWRYRFKAGPGEYYVRVTPATTDGPIIQADALPTLYNISLSPVTPDSSEAGAEISLLPGEFRKVAEGETLFRISQQTGIKVSDLMLVNGIVDEKAIKAGNVLFIPTGQ